MKMLVNLCLHWSVDVDLRCCHVVTVREMQMSRDVGRLPVVPPLVLRLLMSLTTQMPEMFDESFSVLFLLIRQPRFGVEIVVVKPDPFLLLLISW